MFRKTTLAGGLRVVTEKLEGTKAVTMLVLVGAGSRYENKEIRGISHFLEHMFFKGGDRYKDTKEVSEAIDQVGGEFNAFTAKEYAGYYVKVASSSVKIAADVLSDMLLNSKFRQEDIEKERGVILEEYNMYQDTPMYQIGWDFEDLLFGDQPLGWDQIGTKQFIKKVMTDDFKAYKEKLYTSDNIVIALSGAIEHEEAVDLVEKYFKITDGKKADQYLPFEEKEGGKISVREKKTEQAHIALGFAGYAETHPDIWALKLLSVILGGNMSSRMFLGVREAQGLAYYIHTSVDNYMDAGAFVTNAGVDLTRVEDAIKAVIEEYRKVRDDGVTDAELRKAKAFLKGKMVLSLEDSEEFAHLLAKYELLHDQIKTPDDLMKLIDKVKMEDIDRVRKDLIKSDKLKLAVIGPYPDQSKFENLLKF